jgi:sugar phosphate isomerase/epimerase
MKKTSLFLLFTSLFLLNACKQNTQSTTATTANSATEKATDSFRKNIGLQLYSLRNYTKTNLDSALQFVKDQGITDVELAGYAGLTAEQFKAKLAQYGLVPSSIGFGMKELRGRIDKIIKETQLLGCQYVMCAWIDHKADTITLAEMQEGVKVFNAAGKKLKEKGIQFMYHPHGFEFIKHGDKTLMDYLYDNTDPDAVKFEEDIFWATHGGMNAVAFLEKYGNRTVALHVKDMSKSVVTPKYTGKEDVENDVAWGTGQIDIKATLLAAQKLGVKHFYLEDESSAVLKQIPISLKFTEGF